MALRFKRGFGAAVQFTDFPTDFLGYPIPCDVWFNWVGSPSCWKHSLSDWQQMASAARSGSGVPFKESDIVAPAAVPLAYTGAPDYQGTEAEKTAQYQQETSGVLNQAFLQTQANLLQSAREGTGYPGPPTSPGPGGISWMVWAAIAIGGFAVVTLGGGSPRRYGR